MLAALRGVKKTGSWSACVLVTTSCWAGRKLAWVEVVWVRIMYWGVEAETIFLLRVMLQIRAMNFGMIGEIKWEEKVWKGRGKKYLREKSAKWLMYGHWHEQQYRTFSTVYRLIVTGTTDCAIFFPTICSICQLIWSFTCCKVNMHYLPTRSTPVPTKMPIIIGALPIKTSAMTPGQLCRKTEQTEHLVQYSWVKEVKQWWQDHCKRLHLLAPTYIHLDVFKKPIWFGAGLLNELYYGDAS